MNLLEMRYRRALRLLPAAYRAEREEEMVEVFMAGAADHEELDLARPAWSELASVAALAVRLRLGGPRDAPRAAISGQAIRLIAVLGLLTYAALGTAHLLGLMLQFGHLTVGPPASRTRVEFGLELVGSLCWIGAFVTLGRGRPDLAKRLAGAALAAMFAVALSVTAGTSLTGDWSAELGPLVIPTLPATITVIALLAGFHRDIPPAPHPQTLPVLSAVSLFVLALTYTEPLIGYDAALAASTLQEPGALLCALLLLSGVIARRDGLGTAWSLALALLALPLLATRLWIFDFYQSATNVPGSVTLSITTQILTLTLASLALLPPTIKTLRHLPHSRDG